MVGILRLSRLLDELKCLELQQKRSPRQIKFQEVLRIELKEHEIRFNGSWCVFRLSEDPRKTHKQKDFLRTVLSAILKYWRETFPKYNYCDDSLLVATEAMYELIKEETCELNKNACFRDAEMSLVHPLDNYFKESRLKNLNFASLEKSLQVSKASKQIRYLKLSVTSKSTIDNAPVVMLAVSSLSSSTVVDLSGEKIDEDLLKVLKVSFKINKSFRGLTMINPQVDGGFLSDALKFLSPFSLLRLLDVSNKSKNEKDKHDDRVLKGLSANAARNLVDFRINGQNLSAEDVSRLTSGFRNSIVNVSANTLPLISLSLSGNTVKIEDLQYLLSVSPYLRELQLDECQLDVFEVTFIVVFCIFPFLKEVFPRFHSLY
nr:unnamed protein product [Spirometra erinaceieuropaei]